VRVSSAPVDTVLKIGGGVLDDVAAFDAVLALAGQAARRRRLLIVPGGGAFADAVREADRRLTLPDSAAHWMAILAMDQSAHLLCARLDGATIVAQPEEIGAAIDAGRVPVLAPSRWLRDADPLPHSWDVTSDSIAAWVAGRVGARQLVLVKPRGVQRPEHAVDPYFARAVPAGLATLMIAADQADALRLALDERS
jgi:5-(aminomethyl)-3-furanmethanol phosphate kinase